MTDKKMKQIVAAVERGEGDNKKSYWTRIGVAFENRDIMRSSRLWGARVGFGRNEADFWFV